MGAQQYKVISPEFNLPVKCFTINWDENEIRRVTLINILALISSWSMSHM